MKPLLVTAFYDIGRGALAAPAMARSREQYLESCRRYVLQLPGPRFLLATAETHAALPGGFDFRDVAAFKELRCHAYLDATREIMSSPEFRKLFDSEDDHRHMEHRVPEYNVVTLGKWDALERAARLTRYSFSHYVWIDFGIGARAKPTPFLPAPTAFAPIERDRIVVSAERRNRLRAKDLQTLRRQVRLFREQAAGGLMIVPSHLLDLYCDMARRNYELLLSLGLTTDEQLVIDMCIFDRPDMFHLSYPPPGLTKFNHIHNVIHGLDGHSDRKPTLLDSLFKRAARRHARRSIGLDAPG